MSEPDKKRLLVSRDTRTDIWTDDQGDQWKPYYKEESRYASGAWLVYKRGNHYEMVIESVHSDELDARRLAMRNHSVPSEVVFIPWDGNLYDPTERQASDSRSS
jgi:hypothetical protein